MVRIAHLTLSLTALVTVAAQGESAPYTDALHALWDQSDKDFDGYLSEAEFNNAVGLLGDTALTDALAALSPPIYKEDIYREASGRPDGLTKDELIDYLKYHPQGMRAKGPVVDALTNRPQGLETIEIAAPPPAILDALESVGLTIKVAGKLGDIFPGTRKMIKTTLSETMMVPESRLTVTFLPGVAGSMPRRALQGAGLPARAGPSVIITARAFVADAAEATSVLEMAQMAMASASSASSLLDAAYKGIQVLETPTLTMTDRSASEAEKAQATSASGAIFLVLLFGFCGCAICISGKKRAATGEAPQGCTKNGCYSYLAIHAWAGATGLALIWLGLGCGLLYVRMQDVTEHLSCILNNVLELSTIGGPAQSATEILPLVEMRKAQPYQNQLPLAVMLPGCLCIVGLFLASACFASSPKAHFCAKIMHILNVIFLTVALVFYSLFAVVGLAVDFPQGRAHLRMITGTCDTTVPMLQQIEADITNTLSLANALVPPPSAADLAEIVDQVATAESSINLFEGSCACMDKFFDSCGGLYSPGIVCFFAILICFYTSSGMCCSAACCGCVKKDGTASGCCGCAKKDGKAGGKAQEMSNV